uniref:Alpha fetoprotein n=1 Tax=Ailuropoda melanoleuca TaxID=9646 RepID=A0A7N5JD40_AILME
MKWVVSISLIYLLNFSESRTMHRNAYGIASILDSSQCSAEMNLADLATIFFAQFVQEATYKEVSKMVKDILTVIEKSTGSEQPVGCLENQLSAFLEEICEEKEILEKYGLSDCCSQSEEERHNCLLGHKKAAPATIPPFQVPEPVTSCKAYEENRDMFMNRYIYETSRKYPFLYGPTILTMSACYETTIRSCCQEENKTECFQIKLEPIRKYIREISLRHHHLCEIGIKFNHKVAKAVELVLLTKKQPKANFSEIARLAVDIKNLHQTCCEGDVVACVLGRSQIMNYTCSKHSILSSKISPCCALPVPFRGECIIISENDDKPDLSFMPLGRFTEDRSVCKQFSNEPDDLLQEFLYEYSRRHSELAVPVILRVDTVYQNLLAKCCKLENPLECYSNGQEMFRRVIRESHERVKHHCDLHEKLGNANFHDRLIILYTKKAPQLSAQELVTFTKNMAAAATKCCPLRDEQQFACMEDSAKLILGALCRRHEAEPINAGVGHCCDDSYAFRKPCFDDLQVDGTYISPPLSCDQVINLKENLCKAQEEEFQTEKQKVLSNLVKQKPQATEMQFQSVMAEFAHLVKKCCQAETSDMCFREEGSKLIEKCQSLLGSK